MKLFICAVLMLVPMHSAYPCAEGEICVEGNPDGDSDTDGVTDADFSDKEGGMGAKHGPCNYFIKSACKDIPPLPAKCRPLRDKQNPSTNEVRACSAKECALPANKKDAFCVGLHDLGLSVKVDKSCAKAKS